MVQWDDFDPISKSQTVKSSAFITDIYRSRMYSVEHVEIGRLVDDDVCSDPHMELPFGRTNVVDLSVLAYHIVDDQCFVTCWGILLYKLVEMGGI